MSFEVEPLAGVRRSATTASTLLLRPPVARLRGLDFKGGIALIDAGCRYAAEEPSKSGLAKQFMT